MTLTYVRSLEINESSIPCAPVLDTFPLPLFKFLLDTHDDEIHTDAIRQTNAVTPAQRSDSTLCFCHDVIDRNLVDAIFQLRIMLFVDSHLGCLGKRLVRSERAQCSPHVDV